jgi:uncharacterized protein (TIGR02217 family)
VFIETRLLDCVAYASQFGPTWNTRYIPLKSGVARRNPLWSRPHYEAMVLYQNLKPEDHEEVIAAFNACMGRVHSFRLKDWSDFTATNELLPVLGTGSAQSVQLVKNYTFGSQGVARPIRKPVSGSVTMTADGAPLAATVNYATGIASFTAASSDVLRWSGQFDVPVMFAQDKLIFSADTRTALGLMLNGDVALVEDIEA